MILADVQFLPEDPAHEPEIEAINAEAFGPGRFTRAAYRIREAGPCERDLSFVAVLDGAVIASVKMTRVAAGEGRALMLGPLAVKPEYMNFGIGRHLVKLALDGARQRGVPAVMLVGDEPYYGPLGFRQIPRGQASMPRPADPNRMLAVEFEQGAVARLVGMIDHEDVVTGAVKAPEDAEPLRRVG